MSNTDKKTRGRVTEVRPNGLFLVTFPDGNPGDKLCYIAGKMKVNKVKVGIGDFVDVIIDPYGGKTTNRIVWRA